MHILLMPDSFKGSLSAKAVGAAMQSGIMAVAPAAQVTILPMADGGEGTMAVVQSIMGGRWQTLVVPDANGREIQANCLWLTSETVLIESATIVGLPQVQPDTLWQRTTVGLGMAVRQVVQEGATTVLIGLGGTSTNEGGAGLLYGLGARLLAADGSELAPTLAQLSLVERVDIRPALSMMQGVRLFGLSDVENPLCGAEGASAIYGPQKGLHPDEVMSADAALSHWASRVSAAMAGPEVALQAGAGAAGGLGFALLALGGELMGGANWLLAQPAVAQSVRAADWIWTGEGRSDLQTLAGKLPLQVARLARANQKMVTLLSASIASDAIAPLSAHFDGCFSIAQGVHVLSDMIQHAPALLASQSSQLVRLYQASARLPIAT